jgi:hypothetical protein
MVRRLLVTTAVFALLVPAAGAQGTKKDSTTKTKKDSPAAAATRKKLDMKVTVDFNETPLKEATEELKRQVENLSIWIDNAGGVSNNTAITCKATDKPLKEVLDEMFQKNDLGYVIGQGEKGNERYDGWLIIKKGKFRGDAVEPKTAAKPKEPDKEKTEPKPESKEEKAEKDAASRLRVAKKLAADGLTEKAKERYKEIVEKYPNTKAGKEAKALLEK